MMLREHNICPYYFALLGQNSLTSGAGNMVNNLKNIQPVHIVNRIFKNLTPVFAKDSKMTL